MKRRWFLLSGVWLLTLGMFGGAGAVTKNIDILVTHTSGGIPQTLLWVNPNAVSFVAKSGNANQALAKLTPGMWPASPDFTGTCAISGGDSSLFAINSSTCTLSIGASDITTSRLYTFNLVATQSGVVGSPYTQAMTITGLTPGTFTRTGTTTSGSQVITGLSSTSDLFPGTVVTGTGIPADTVVETVNSSSQITLHSHTATANGSTTLAFQEPLITVDNYHPSPGAPINVTVQNAPNVNSVDYYQLAFAGSPNNNSGGNRWRAASPGPNNGSVTSYGKYLGSGVHSGTFSLTMPSGPSDNNTYYTLHFYLDNGFTVASVAGWITVPPTTPHTAPAAANTLANPWVPQHVHTVCPSGCDYTTPSAAIGAAQLASEDYVQVKISPGAYVDCYYQNDFGGGRKPVPPHLWIKGIGGDFPMWGWKICGSKGVFVWNGGSVAGAALYVDNMGFGDWPQGGSGNGAAIRIDGCGDVFLRNDYIHDGTMGVLTGAGLGSCTSIGNPTYTIQNTHFARSGGVNGPSHNVYIGGWGESYLNIKNSISEQTPNGHEIKTRSIISTLTCNFLLGTRDDAYIDSELLDMAEGREDHLRNNLFVKGGAVNLNSTQENEIGYGLDFESQYATNNYLDMQGNILINDDMNNLNKFMWFLYVHPRQADGSSGNFTPTHPIPWPYYASDASGPLGAANIFIAPYITGGSIKDVHAYYYTNSSNSDPTVFTDSGNLDYANRAAAGFGSTALPIPSACTGQTIGNMAIPAN